MNTSWKESGSLLIENVDINSQIEKIEKFLTEACPKGYVDVCRIPVNSHKWGDILLISKPERRRATLYLAFERFFQSYNELNDCQADALIRLCKALMKQKLEHIDEALTGMLYEVNANISIARKHDVHESLFDLLERQYQKRPLSELLIAELNRSRRESLISGLEKYPNLDVAKSQNSNPVNEDNTELISVKITDPDNIKLVDDPNAMIWYLEGESTLAAITVPEKPAPSTNSLVRMSHVNIYGPVEFIEFYVRMGDPQNPTADDAINVHSDWIKLELVEELLSDEEEVDRWVLRSDYTNGIDQYDEIPWAGTFETTVNFSQGLNSIEIKVISTDPKFHSFVLTGWHVESE